MSVVVREAKTLDVTEAGTVQADATPRNAAIDVVEPTPLHIAADACFRVRRTGVAYSRRIWLIRRRFSQSQLSVFKPPVIAYGISLSAIAPAPLRRVENAPSV